VTSAALDALDIPHRLNRPEPAWRRENRLAAIDWLAHHSMPTRSEESWRYIPVGELVDLLGAAVQSGRTFGLMPGQVDVMAGDHGGPRLVFVNGVFAPEVSFLRDDPAFTARPLSALERDSTPGPGLETDRLDGFVALNSLAGDDGAVITVTAAHTATSPIHIVHVAGPDLDSCLVTHPSSVVRIQPGATATIIESYVGFTGAALTNAATVIDVHDAASLNYHRVQTESSSASHVGHVRIRAGHDASVACTSFSIGGRVARIAFDISLVGDHARVAVEGLYVPVGNDRHDQVVTAEHIGSHTRSHQRFKGVIADRARGSFSGHVLVQPGTIDTVADQTNHSLLLTATAESDSRPWLEILADDVRCTHGATVGRLDDEALFYLRTRGIPETEARTVLIQGFTGEVLDTVTVETLRDHLSNRVRARHARLPHSP
jgi:Fe-S cluster assembly protein SufD